MKDLSTKPPTPPAPKPASENYTVIKEFRTTFEPGLFNEKIVHVLLKYDFLVGDFADDHLRLKGFYHDKRRDVEATKKASKIEKYITESCNYMCPHFVLEKNNVVIPENNKKKHKPKGKPQPNQQKKRPKRQFHQHHDDDEMPF